MQRPDRHHGRRPRGRPGGAADRGRPAGLHLLGRRRAGPPRQPRPRPLERAPGGAGGLPVLPGSAVRHAHGRCASWPRASTSSGSRSVLEGSELLARCDPARDRPPRRHPLHRPARPRAAQGGHEGGPRGRVGRAGDTRGQGQPAQPPSAGACEHAPGLRRHPRGRPCPRWTPCSPRSTRWSRSSPGPMRGPGAAEGSLPSPVRVRAEEAGLEVLTPARPSDPEFQERLRELAPDVCPVVAYGALVPPAALDIPRLGWVNLHFSLLPAWRGRRPRAARHHGRRRGDRRLRPSSSSRGWTPGRSSGS